ncbi:outer membrane domain protein [Burkholderia cepacia]|uniref:Outer membrane domain protein n=1 Tax=Burkholderia cepacia TaxID=292 RepID=A0AA88YXJ5_BURCE|nr:outer membrane domain protein [Burkholderia cepacia]
MRKLSRPRRQHRLSPPACCSAGRRFAVAARDTRHALPLSSIRIRAPAWTRAADRRSRRNGRFHDNTRNEKTVVGTRSLACFGAIAHARGSITLDGMLDAGIAYTNNQSAKARGGKAAARMHRFASKATSTRTMSRSPIETRCSTARMSACSATGMARRRSVAGTAPWSTLSASTRSRTTAHTVRARRMRTGATLGFANVTGLATPSTRTQRAATIGIRHRLRPQAACRRPAALCNPAWTRAGRTGIIRGIRARASAKPVHSAPGARRIGIRRRPAADSEIATP